MKMCVMLFKMLKVQNGLPNGPLLLEIMSGKRNQGFCYSDDHLNLLGYVSVKSFIQLIYFVD